MSGRCKLVTVLTYLLQALLLLSPNVLVVEVDQLCSRTRTARGSVSAPTMESHSHPWAKMYVNSFWNALCSLVDDIFPQKCKYISHFASVQFKNVSHVRWWLWQLPKQQFARIEIMRFYFDGNAEHIKKYLYKYIYVRKHIEQAQHIYYRISPLYSVFQKSSTESAAICN